MLSIFMYLNQVCVELSYQAIEYFLTVQVFPTVARLTNWPNYCIVYCVYS